MRWNRDRTTEFSRLDIIVLLSIPLASMNIELSDHATRELVKLQALESGRVGNFSRIEPAIDRLRYRIFDLIMSEVMKELTNQQQ
jgi:hypothetical protein